MMGDRYILTVNCPKCGYEDDDVYYAPTCGIVDWECPKCGNNEAYWILRQTRASDEPETRIYTCTKCHHRWRAY